MIIPTSGNLGIAVAAAAAKTHRVIVVVPEKTSSDRIQMLKALGAEIMRSPTEARPDAPESAFSVAAKLKEQLPNSYVIEEVSKEDMDQEKLLIRLLLRPSWKESTMMSWQRRLCSKQK